MAQSWSKKIRKMTRPARHWLLWRTAISVDWLIGHLPEYVALRLGATLGWLGWIFDRRDRRLALKHLKEAFGEGMDEVRRRWVARGAFMNLGRCAAEICLARRRGLDFIRERYTISGDTDKVRECIERGQGFIFVTAHLDNWELLGAAAVALLKAPMMPVAQIQSDSMIDRWLNETRRQLGMRIHTRGQDARALLKALREGAAVSVLLDQDTSGAGCFVPFFGKPAFTLTGPALLALRTGSPVFMGFSWRNPDGRTHRIRVTGPIELPPPAREAELSNREAECSDSGVKRCNAEPKTENRKPKTDDRESQARELTRLFMSETEKAIREAPEQWVWFHKRWKHQPETEEGNSQQSV
ncbi:MAG: lysophospholipid acyltransferase family protein [Candidatus Sumerlaeota bacterium]|nr:lysophospholipid acyltransferase family protein [Candidatus Sumerlaeota bacterium]